MFRQVRVKSDTDYELPWISEELAVEGGKIKYKNKIWTITDIYNKSIDEKFLEDFEKWVI